MKQEIKIIAVALALVLIFLSGVVVGKTGAPINVTVNGGATGTVADAGASAGSSSSGSLAGNTGSSGSLADNSGSNTPPASDAGSTTPPASDAGSTTPPASDAGSTTPPASDAGSTSSTPSSNQEIVDAYNKAINDYRAYTGKVTTHKVEVVDIKVTDGVPAALQGVVNDIVAKFAGTNENEWTFENGVDVNGTKLGEKFIPWGRDAAVTLDALSAASCTPNSDGGYTIKITFVAEKSSFDGTTTVDPVHHMKAMDPLNLATLDISPLSISAAEMNYPGATVEATVDASGKLVKLHNYLPLEGSGTGGMGFIKATIGLGGSMDSTYTITYA